MAFLFLILLILLQPVNLYLHDETRTGDDKWIHYNTNVKISDIEQIAYDLNNLSGTESKIAVYFFTDFETTVYGSMINYYYANNFSTLDDFSPKLIFLPPDMLNNPAKFAKLNGITYFVYNGKNFESFTPDNFTLIKQYPDNTRLFQYSGSGILLGSLSDSPIDNPFTIIDYYYYTQNVYYWTEAEEANISSGNGYRPYGNEWSSGIYGIASNGIFHFLKNNGSYSSYFFNIEKSGYYNVWIRMGAYAPLNVVINNTIYKISPKSSQFEWYLIGPLYFNSNQNEIKTISLNYNYAIYDALLVTSDLDYHPTGISKPRHAGGIPNFTSRNGYTLWQNESYWTIVWQSRNNQEFSVKINTSDDIGFITSSNKSLLNKISNSSYFIRSGKDEIQFSTKSNYLTFDLQ